MEILKSFTVRQARILGELYPDNIKKAKDKVKYRITGTLINGWRQGIFYNTKLCITNHLENKINGLCYMLVGKYATLHRFTNGIKDSYNYLLHRDTNKLYMLNYKILQHEYSLYFIMDDLYSIEIENINTGKKSHITIL